MPIWIITVLTLRHNLKNGIKSNSKYIMIIGEDELEKQVVSIKNTETQEQEQIPVKIAIRTIKKLVR